MSWSSYRDGGAQAGSGRWTTFRRDLRVRLALAGYPSLTVRYCSSTIEHPSVTTAQIAATRTHHLLADVEGCVRTARRMHPGLAVALCGFSMGASIAFLAAADAAVAALLALDGGIPATADRRRSARGCVDNPFAHARFVRLGTCALSARTEPTEDADVLRWRLSQDLRWPMAQVEEVRCGVLADGTPMRERLRLVTCPVLAVCAGDREPVADRRARRTAELTSATRRIAVDLPAWTHEQIATRRSDRADGFWDRVRDFLEEVA